MLVDLMLNAASLKKLQPNYGNLLAHSSADRQMIYDVLYIFDQLKVKLTRAESSDPKWYLDQTNFFTIVDFVNVLNLTVEDYILLSDIKNFRSEIAMLPELFRPFSILMDMFNISTGDASIDYYSNSFVLSNDGVLRIMKLVHTATLNYITKVQYGYGNRT